METTNNSKAYPLAYKLFRCPAGCDIHNVNVWERQIAGDINSPMVFRTHTRVKIVQRSKYDPHVGKKQLSKISN